MFSVRALSPFQHITRTFQLNDWASLTKNVIIITLLNFLSQFLVVSLDGIIKIGQV